MWAVKPSQSVTTSHLGQLGLPFFRGS